VQCLRIKISYPLSGRPPKRQRLQEDISEQVTVVAEDVLIINIDEETVNELEGAS
jgi:hypothetical protein